MTILFPYFITHMYQRMQKKVYVCMHMYMSMRAYDYILVYMNIRTHTCVCFGLHM